MTDLHAQDARSWTNTIWGALHDYRENSIPESDPTYDDQWGDICSAMAWIQEALGVPEETDS